MPFTPFHMGPGLAFKALGGRHFSLLSFGYSQVLMDIQPLFAMVSGSGDLHGWSHTLSGALLLGAAATVSGKPLCEQLLRFLRWRAQGSSFARYCPHTHRIAWPAIASGAFIGSFSHLLFDGLMHADMYPLQPFSDAQPLLHRLSLGNLHGLCLALAVAGLALLAWRRYR